MNYSCFSRKVSASESAKTNKGFQHFVTLQFTGNASASEQMANIQRAHVMIAAAAVCVSGDFFQSVQSVSTGGRFPGKKEKEFKECQRPLWGKQMVLLSKIHQNP